MPSACVIFPREIGLKRPIVDLTEGRTHDDVGKEERQSDEQLVRRHVRRAQRLAQERQDHDDPRERSHHDQDRGREREDREQEEHLQHADDFRRTLRVL